MTFRADPNPYTFMTEDDRNLLIVGIGDLKFSGEPGDVLVTYSLGSCIGVTLYDRVLRCGGMIHALLPWSRDSMGTVDNPMAYMDKALEKLLSTLFGQGSRRSDIVARVAGGAAMFEDRSNFRIGERNFTIARKILWKNSILISGEDVGGTISRTLYLDIETGITYVRSEGAVREL